MQKLQPSLIFCLIMDLLGAATYALPFLGELGDILWAPISSVIFFITFGGWKGFIGGIANLAEEVLPGTDFIPSFTLMWLMQRYQQRHINARIKSA